MKGLNVVCGLVFLVCLLRESKGVEAESDGVYIVYMGAAAASRDNHNLLVSSLVRRKRNAVVHNYRNGFLGFAARLTKTEAQDMARKPGVVSVFPDPIFKLHTTRSWDFLKYQTGVEIDLKTFIFLPSPWPNAENNQKPSQFYVLITNDILTTNAIRKIIGARYYKGGGDFNTSRDKNGHGTHVASTAAGKPVSNASYYGLATGSAKGGFPGARIAVYKVCGVRGCLGSAIMAAFDDAIEDGVDVLSLSLGASAGYGPNFQNDPIAIGAFHAVEKGITVVCSAGNDGPSRETAVNVAPWILTVAASSIDRDFQAEITLGDKTVITGGGINFSDLQKSPVYPLLYGSSAKKDSSRYDESDARNCIPRALDANKVKGHILLCDNEDGIYTAKEKLAIVKLLGATGMILISDEGRAVASSYGSFPMASVNLDDGSKIAFYVNTTRNPTATIQPTISVTGYKPAPVIPYFSARGPSFAEKDVIKPDVAAPGVAILASWPDNDSVVTLGGKSSPHFYIISGTSMACPHVSGLAAMIKSQNPNWSPSAIKSAMMTTASQTNNMKKPITTNYGTDATPYDFGAGEVSSSPLQPGLIYETETVHLLLFLCGVGYDITTIKLISSTVPPEFSCPDKSSNNLVSNMNYPSMAVSLSGEESKQVNRTVTNVDGGETTYTVSMETPKGLDVKVTPNTLQFTESSKQLTYQVSFTANGKLAEDNFGSITWSNGKYKVRSPFVVSSS